jgi:predicted DNA-binding helix-hairpin-helix protein
MVGVISKPDTQEKLAILSADARYDLACACGTARDEHRKRGPDGKWIYPVTLGDGRRTYLFKTLISNICCNDCKYCPLRTQADLRRCSLSVEETVNVFLQYLHRKAVSGLFLSSGCVGSADATMDKLNTAARILRKRHGFRGYIHLKIIPGSSQAAVEDALFLADSVSINIETPGEVYLRRLSDRKNYLKDIIGPLRLVAGLVAPGQRYAGKSLTTQFVVGSAGETDAEIVRYTTALYKRLGMHRVYFSAYQRGLGDASLPAEQGQGGRAEDVFMREHRLYQVDFLLRKYGFGEAEIVFDERGQLPLSADPKETWAARYPEFFPVDVNCASRQELLRVPGLGPVSVKLILERRRRGRIQCLEDIAPVTSRLAKAGGYLTF